MPTKIETPQCLKELLGRIYPKIDLDRVIFYDGLPFYAIANPGAITVGRRVYFRKGKFDPCDCAGIALVAHELYHIHQGANGFGFWFLRWFYIRYVWLWLTRGFRRGKEHPLEAPAYGLQRRVSDCCERVRQSTGQASPCVCQDGTPTGVNQAFLDAFDVECPNLLGHG